MSVEAVKREVALRLAWLQDVRALDDSGDEWEAGYRDGRIAEMESLLRWIEEES